MLKSYANYLLLIFFVFLTGCTQTGLVSRNVDSQKQLDAVHHQSSTMVKEDLFLSLLRSEYQYWRGTPYRLGGTTKKGIDCSALIQAIYRNSFKIKIPRTTREQVKLGSHVNRSELEVSDLVFFKSTRKVRHVGIYLGNNQFLHASVSKGVIISSLDNSYWNAHYWKSRRAID